MDLSFTEEQEMLKKTARDFLSKECSKDLVKEMEEDEKGCSLELWNKMAELGWLGLPFPEKYDGIGGSFLDLVILLSEMGRALVPGPFIPTVVTSGLPILHYGNELQKGEKLPKIASGKLIMTFALMEPSASLERERIETEAERLPQGFSLKGTKLFVPDAHIAHEILCPARTKEGITVFVLGPNLPGINITTLKTLAGDKQCEVSLENVKVSEENVLGEVGGGWEIMEKAKELSAVALCGFMNGAAREVLEMSVEYAKERVQFDRLIGTFQAIQHMCADMVTAIEGSEYLAYQAAWKIDKGLPAEMEVSMAKAWASEALKEVWWKGLKIHGGVGLTIDHDLQLYFRRGKVWEHMFGNGEYHWEKVAQGMKL